VSQLPQDAARRLVGRLDAPEHVFGADPALQLAALCWQHPTTRHTRVDPVLASVIAAGFRAMLAELERRVDECLLLREYVDANEHYVATVARFDLVRSDRQSTFPEEAAAEARYSAACDALRAWRAKQPGATDVQPMPEQPQ
jgi:hypothetical protein